MYPLQSIPVTYTRDRCAYVVDFTLYTVESTAFTWQGLLVQIRPRPLYFQYLTFDTDLIPASVEQNWGVESEQRDLRVLLNFEFEKDLILPTLLFFYSILCGTLTWLHKSLGNNCLTQLSALYF